MPMLCRPARRQAINVDPVPTMGSRTVWPRLVKNSTNSWASVSGNLAGCRRTSLLRGGGLWRNHDFWKRIHSFAVRSLSRLRKGGRPVMASSKTLGGWSQGWGGRGEQAIDRQMIEGDRKLAAGSGAGDQAEAAARQGGIADEEYLETINEESQVSPIGQEAEAVLGGGARDGCMSLRLRGEGGRDALLYARGTGPGRCG